MAVARLDVKKAKRSFPGEDGRKFDRGWYKELYITNLTALTVMHVSF